MTAYDLLCILINEWKSLSPQEKKTIYDGCKDIMQKHWPMKRPVWKLKLKIEEMNESCEEHQSIAIAAQNKQTNRWDYQIWRKAIVEGELREIIKNVDLKRLIGGDIDGQS